MTVLLIVDAVKGVDPRELDRIETASRIVEPRDGSQIFAEVTNRTRFAPSLAELAEFASASWTTTARA